MIGLFQKKQAFFRAIEPGDRGMAMDSDAKRMKERVAAIKERHPNYRGILEFFEKLLMEQMKARTQVDFQPPEISEDRARIRAKEGSPILAKGDFPVDPHLADRLFRSICRISKRENEKLKVEVEKIQKALRLKKINLEMCLRKVAEGDHDYLSRIAADAGIDQGVMNFVLHTTIKPFVEAMASHLKDMVDEDLWEKGSCPICGSHPLMGELRGEEGRRIWTCSFCGTQWRGKRVMCPFCENTDQGSLRYFYTEKDKAYRIDICDTCKRYIKTVDSREFAEEIFLPVEDIATLHLDILAANKGFKRETFNFLGIF